MVLLVTCTSELPTGAALQWPADDLLSFSVSRFTNFMCKTNNRVFSDSYFLNFHRQGMGWTSAESILVVPYEAFCKSSLGLLWGCCPSFLVAVV